MIKDTLFKSLLIPLLGILIPLMAGLIDIERFTANQVVFSNVLFILTSYIIWQGNTKIISNVRVRPWLSKNIFLKLLVLCFLTVLYSCIVIGFSCFVWQLIFLPDIHPSTIIRCCGICAAIVIFLTVVYETIFLSKERELDVQVLNQLDNERIYAELNSLKKELDPHFLFNSLTTLSQLIKEDPDKADSFIQKLASIYKYFLVNKDKDFVLLGDELDFIDNYYYLLKIRFDENIKIHIRNEVQTENMYILPFTLQTLIENAIKHNTFSEEEPLNIHIIIDSDCIAVKNNIRPKPVLSESTKVGLKNLKARYKLISKEDVQILTVKNRFIVKLPFVKQN